jgi:hypothetical protein
MWLALLFAAATESRDPREADEVLADGIRPDPAQVLAAIDAGASVLETIRYGAVRTTVSGETRVTEHWRFVSEAGGRFRIDYFGDTQRQVASDGEVLTEYVPVRREARRYHLAQMTAEARNQLLAGILGKVTLPGVRTGWAAAASLAAPAWGEDTLLDGRTVWTILATGTDGAVLRFEVDRDHGFLLASEIREADRFVVRTEARGHRELSPGLWLPTDVTALSSGPMGPLRVELHVTGPDVGKDADDALFHIGTDPSIHVIDLP